MYVLPRTVATHNLCVHPADDLSLVTASPDEQVETGHGARGCGRASSLRQRRGEETQRALMGWMEGRRG